MTDVLDPTFARSFLDRWNAAWRAMDTEALVAMCAEEITVDDTGLHRAIQGREGVAEYLAGLVRAAAIESTEDEGTYLSLDRERLAVRHRTTVRPAGSEATVTVAGVAIFEFADGLVSRWTAYVRDRDWMSR